MRQAAIVLYIVIQKNKKIKTKYVKIIKQNQVTLNFKLTILNLQLKISSQITDSIKKFLIYDNISFSAYKDRK